MDRRQKLGIIAAILVGVAAIVSWFIRARRGGHDYYQSLLAVSPHPYTGKDGYVGWARLLVWGVGIPMAIVAFVVPNRRMRIFFAGVAAATLAILLASRKKNWLVAGGKHPVEIEPNWPYGNEWAPTLGVKEWLP